MNSSPVRLTIPEPNTIGLEDQAYLRGTKVSIDQMGVDESYIKQSKTQNIRFQFGTSTCTLIFPHLSNSVLIYLNVDADKFYETARSNNQLRTKPSALHCEFTESQRMMN